MVIACIRSYGTSLLEAFESRIYEESLQCNKDMGINAKKGQYVIHSLAAFLRHRHTHTSSYKRTAQGTCDTYIVA